MNGFPACPRPADLERLLLGRMPDAEAAALEQHVERCPRCLQAVRDLRLDDPLVAVVRDGARAGALSGENVDEGLITLLCRLADRSGAATPHSSSPTLDRAATAAPSLAPPEEPDELGRFGPYGILRVLGSGGMGIVYAARQSRPRRVVALKMILAGSGVRGTHRARFRSETEVAGRLRHPNIVGVYEAGEHDGCPYFTMEYVEGGTLAQKLAAAPLAHGVAAKLLETLAEAVAYAHERGVIHRDLKPSNVLLAEAHGLCPQAHGLRPQAHGLRPVGPVGAVGFSWVPKISDFGLAKELSGDAGEAVRTESGAILGTPGYMAPEQALGGEARKIGPSADVYSLGAILYECLTGRPPFKAASVLETLEQVRSQEPVPPRSLQPSVPRDLQTVCLKCLEKEPSRRYASASDLAADLGRFLRGEPIHARPTPLLVRLGKWTRRRPTLAALTGLSAALLAALVVVGVAYQVRLRAALQRADDNAKEMTRQRERADAGYRQARDTLNHMTGRVQNRALGEIPQLKELQHELLHDALKFYQGVFAGADDPDPQVRLDTAVAYQQAGGIQALLGQSEDAARSWQRGVELLEGLPPEEQGTPQALAALAGSCNALGLTASDRQRWDEAERHHRRAVEVSERLVKALDNDFRARERLAESEHDLGDVFLRSGRQREAEPYYQRAVSIRTEILRERPENEAVQTTLAEDHINLALLYQGTERGAEAHAEYEKAEALLRPLVARGPHGERALSLAILHINRSYLLRTEKNYRLALQHLDEAVRTAEGVLAREPRHAAARLQTYNAHGARAQLHEEAGRFADAVKDWDRVVELDRSQALWLNRALRALALARAGDHARAAAEAKALEADATTPPEGRYNLACVYALAIGPAKLDPNSPSEARERLAEGYAAAAVAVLGKLREQGYFKDANNARTLKEDTDLQPLRARDDFRRLLD